MKKIICIALICALFLSTFCFASAEAEDFYLGDHPELVTSFSGLEDLIGYNTAHSGDDIVIGEDEYDTGLGLHCNPSDQETYIEIDISGLTYDYFLAYVGMQSYSANGVFLDWGSAKFLVYGDGELLATSDVCKYGEDAVQLSCEIKGVKTLKLVQDNYDGHSCDWGVWGDAMLTNTQPPEQEKKEEEEPEFSMDKTDIVTPEDKCSGDYVYASDMYWTDSATYGTNIIGRDVNTADEWIFDSDLNMFDKGLGMHASSDGYTTYVEINIADMGFKKFASYYGICGTATQYDISMACVKFAVFGDGNLLFESEEMCFNEPFEYMECDISGVSTLKIAVAGAPSISGAWGTWGGAVLIREGDGVKILSGESDKTAAPVVTATPAPEKTEAPATEKPTIAPAADTEEESGNTASVIIIAVAATVIIAAAVAIILVKKGKKK